jgi:hypothetical protein
MGKINWTRVFLGGLLAGIVLNILGFATMAMYLRGIWKPEVEALNPDFQETIGFWIFWIVFYFVLGILAVWLYSAIRPRYGAGAKTGVIAGLAVWILGGLSFAAISASFGLFPVSLLVIDGLTFLVMLVVATLFGAWVYREQSQ